MKPSQTSHRPAIATPLVELRAARLMPAIGLCMLLALLLAGSQSARATITTVTNKVAGLYTWVCPVGVTSVQVECWGAGGAGGSCVSGTGAAGGGAGGAYARTNSYAVTANNTYYIQVGAAGLTNVVGNFAGGAGGYSSFSNSTPALVVLAVGGGGGGGGAAGTGGTAGTCPAGSVGGSAVFLGGAGHAGIPTNTTSHADACGGGGGGSGGTNSVGNAGLTNGAAAAVPGGGPGAAAITSGGNGSAPASGPGGAGSGAYSTGTFARLGGSGYAGQVILTYNTINDFKSVATGNWSSTSTWDVSNDGGITWAPATVVPDSTATAIFITNGFSVTVDQPFTSANLVIDSISTLVLGNGGELNGGIDPENIVMNGVYNDTSDYNQTNTGVISGAGSLNLNGTAILTLSATNTYTGNTVIGSGELMEVTGGSASSSALQLQSATSTNSVNITSNVLTWTYASLTAMATGDLDFNFGSILPSTTVAPLIITGQANFNLATPVVSVEVTNLNGGNISVGTYPLMTWGSIAGTAPTSVTLPSGVTGNLSVIGKTLYLVVTTGNALVKANDSNNLTDPGSWVGDVVPSDLGIWDATVTSANTTILGGGLALAGIQILDPGGPVTIDADGNTLTNGVAGIDMSLATVDLTLDCNIVITNSETWNVASGRTLTVNGTTITAITNGAINKQGLGTVVVNDTVVNMSATEDVLNGVLIYNGSIVTNSDRVIPDATAGNAARLIITNGSSVQVSSTVNNLRSGRAGAATGTNYTDVAGLFSCPNAVIPNGYATMYGGCAYSEMTFYPGGDFTAYGVTNYSGIGNTEFRFNGGIVRARTNSAYFFQGISNTVVLAGGANFDDGGFVITVNQALLNGGGGGGLTKIGAGSLILGGTNTYTGNTVINAGTLAFAGGGSIASSQIAINTGAELAGFTGSAAAPAAAVTVGSTTSTNSISITDNTKGWTNASLIVSAAGDLDFNFGNVFPSTTVAPLQITGLANFTAAAPMVSIEGNNISVGTHPLISWGSISGTAPATAQLTLPAGVSGTLSVAGKTLYLNVTVGNAIVKANNTDNLNNPLSWATGIEPTNQAIWDSTVTSANTTILGGNLAWAGIEILNPSGLVTISADGNTLTNGAAGIDMSSATANLTLNCNVDMSASNNWNVAAGRTLTVGGVISDNYVLTKQGAGTLVLTGANTYSNLTTVSGGVVTVGSGGVITNVGSIIVADLAGTSGVLNIAGGTVYDGSPSVSLHLGTSSGSIGVINISSGTLTSAAQMFLGNAGAGLNAFGALIMSGGTASFGSFLAPGRGSAANSQSRGEVIVTGGDLSVATNNIEIGSFQCVPTNTCAMTVSGSSTTTLGSAAGSLYVGSSANGNLTVSNSATVTVLNPSSAVQFGKNNAGLTGILNLNGGTIITPEVTQGPGNAGYFNFNGGTLEANKANTTFMTNLTAAYVYSGGAVINDGGNDITIAVPLLAPAGSGVSLAGMTFSGSGFLAPPIVDVFGTGVGASAVATIDGNGNINSVSITSAGSGYTGTPTLMFTDGGGTVITTGTPSLAANTSGGLTKNGSGILTLSSNCTYAGNTVITAGTLALTGSGSISASHDIIVNAGTILDVSATTPGWAVSGGQILSGTGTVNGNVTVNGTLAPGISTNGTLSFNGGVTLAGTTTMKINHDNGISNDKVFVIGTLTNGGALSVVINGSSPLQVNDSFTLFNASSGLIGNFVSTNLPAGYTWDTSQLGAGTIRVMGTSSRTHPTFTKVTPFGNSIILSGTNATGTYVLYSATNLAGPTINWTPVYTNSFTGNFSFTNSMSGQQKFYLLQ